jgi:uncharacterized cupin superfamily protein
MEHQRMAASANATFEENRVGAVVDLRGYAAGTSPSSDWVHGRASPAFSDVAASVAALAPVGEGHVETLAADEFALVIAGRLEIDAPAGRLVLETSRSGVTPAGTSFHWRAAEGTLVIIATVPAAMAGEPDGPVPIDESAALTPSSPPLAELLIGPVPECRNHSDYRSATGEFVCGTWDSTPYHRRQTPYAHIELMHLLEGRVSFYDEKGRVTFNAGDVLLFVRGEGCAWQSEVQVKKVYATNRPVRPVP